MATRRPTSVHPAATLRRDRRRMRLVGVAAPIALLALTACSTTNPMTTRNNYQASDGVSVALGDVTLSNLVVLAAEEGGPGTLLGAVSNDGSDRATIRLTVADQTSDPLRVDAGGTVVLGPESDETVDLESVSAAPGALIDVQVDSDLGGASTVRVPVLDGTLPEYADLVPDAG